jgi:hypothetical protein
MTKVSHRRIISAMHMLFSILTFLITQLSMLSTLIVAFSYHASAPLSQRIHEFPNLCNWVSSGTALALPIATHSTATISSISSSGDRLVPNLLYSPLEEEGDSSISTNIIEVTQINAVNCTFVVQKPLSRLEKNYPINFEDLSSETQICT